MNVTGLPVAPSRLALSVLTPDPSTQLETVATPEALLTALPPDTTPPPLVTVNVTVAPATGLPASSLTTTDGAGLWAPPVTPVAVVGEFAVRLRMTRLSRNAAMSWIIVHALVLGVQLLAGAGMRMPPMATPAGELLNAGEL